MKKYARVPLGVHILGYFVNQKPIYETININISRISAAGIREIVAKQHLFKFFNMFAYLNEFRVAVIKRRLLDIDQVGFRAKENIVWINSVKLIDLQKKASLSDVHSVLTVFDFFRDVVNAGVHIIDEHLCKVPTWRPFKSTSVPQLECQTVP